MIVPQICILEPGELANTATRYLAADIAAVIAERGTCRLGLAGGSTPQPIYAKLADTPLSERVDWKRVHLFWGDERCVPPDHESSNYRMAARALIDRVPIPPENVHRIEGERPPQNAARSYAELIGEEPIDILLLGMGADGHTASLFPGSDFTTAGPRAMEALGPVEPRIRITLSLGAINESRAVYFLISGADKADRLAEILGQIEAGKPALPAAHVQPAGGRLVWIVDADAGRKIQTSLAEDSKLK